MEEESPLSSRPTIVVEGLEMLDQPNIISGRDRGRYNPINLPALPHQKEHAPTPSFDKKGHSFYVHKETRRAPDASCCFLLDYWHPTHATVTIDGKRYLYSARAHRKLRFLVPLSKSQPSTHHRRPLRLFCWEPHIVTWYICFIGVIANTLWVINGIYAVWPGLTSERGAEMITYNTGVIGAFLFIVTAYLGFVEAINHSHASVQVPDTAIDIEQSSPSYTKPRRHFTRPMLQYGQWMHPLFQHTFHEEDYHKSRLLLEGYPVIQDCQTKELIIPQSLETFFDEQDPTQNSAFIHTDRQLDIRVGSHVLRVQPTEWKRLSSYEQAQYSTAVAALPTKTIYRWWTWTPDWHHLGIFNAVVFLIATILFFLPACLWYPMADREAPLGSTIFWVYVLQIIPSIGFIYVGWASMAEVSGYWLLPAWNDIGWWIGFCNMIGGWGFLLYPVLFLPEEIDPDGDHGTLAKWGAAFATFWGSCFFWVAGILQCIEFSNQHNYAVNYLDDPDHPSGSQNDGVHPHKEEDHDSMIGYKLT